MNFIDRYAEGIEDRPLRAPTGTIPIGIVLGVFIVIAIIWRMTN